ncbi:unnamed protein product [Heligmosomoides polygyrus]|uniref:Transposase n=1 Tax=Heligmosomoides polygyrus TaxID=6339 RepID=A0A183F3P2_HELPZ|nr:unnamed protein product [Heligmosomoides polygyrus]
MQKICQHMYLHSYTPFTAPKNSRLLGQSDRRVVGTTGVLNTNLVIDRCERVPDKRIARLRLNRCGSVPALTAFVA